MSATCAVLVARTAATALAIWLLGHSVHAQSRTPPSAETAAPDSDGKRWSLQSYLTSYAIPEDDNYIQPTLLADRGRLHLEARVNYEDRRSASGFIGWNLAFGDRIALSLTPMLGVVAGDTDGIIPALELAVAWGRVDVYTEGEYVLAVNDRHRRYLYSWSEVSTWPTDWLRAGLAFQQTRAYETSRDIQRGFLAGAARGRVNGTVYWFNPGDSQQFVVFTIGVTL